jgi:superfamily II DNA or RNA helicase
MKFIKHLNGKTWKAVIDAKWWPNQRKAVDVAADYLDAKKDQQAMIRMPTGTGKTVVIATLAQLLEDYQRVLVVAPWENLVDQLEREILAKLWAKLGETTSLTPRPTTVFTPAGLKTALKKVKQAGVLVCTNQTLQALRKDNAAFHHLRRWITLGLVDEGHREPAPRWAEAVRELECPTVLFTATPYRNDLQLFDVNRDYFYSYTFGEAVEDRIVREVEFIDGAWSRSGATSVDEFVTKLLDARRSTEKEVGLQPGQMRAIVRCAEAADVKAVASALRARGETVIGVHERFKPAEGAIFRREVPDPDTEMARFWVHQNKLIEGLDDPAFRLVAIFGAFPNARNLVQQIGRVIRNPSRATGQKAFVLAHQQDRQKDLWNRFIDYEKNVRDRKAAGHAELAAFDEFISSHANAPRFYLLGDFRRHLRADEISDPRLVVQMRKSVLVRVEKTGFNWRKLVFAIQSELLTGDAVGFGGNFQDKTTYLHLFQIFEQSDIVNEAYLEIRLGYVFAKQLGKYLFFYDSEGRTPEYLKKATASIMPEVLHRLLPDEKTTIKEVSLINGDFGNRASRRRVVSMDSLEVVPPALSDYAQVCSTATGSVRKRFAALDETRRRYLSFTRGRFSERTTPIIDYAEFEDWLERVSKDLDDGTISGDDTLMRFARPHKYDGTEEPRHILFDVANEELDTTALDGGLVRLDVEKHWLIENGKFHGEIDDKPFEARLTFNPEAQRFEIESEQLDKVCIRDTGRVFTKYLNETQNFRVLLGTSNVYTQGSFFTPNLLPWRGGGNRLNIQKIVVGCAGLEGIKSEKGDKTGWSKDSVFGALRDKTQVFAAAKWTPEVLVCNDVGNPEIADFFGLCETTKRLVMIHGKNAKGGSSMSASAFHEVCSQAVRYLGFFNPTDHETKLTREKIADDWCPNRAKHPVLPRVVWAKGNPTPAALAKKFTIAIEDPTFDREVWLVMGNGLSQKAFEQAVAKSNPKPNEREISYLFQSTWCAVASVGTALRVFCMR